MKPSIALSSGVLAVLLLGCGPSVGDSDGGPSADSGLCVISENVEFSCFDNQDNDCDGYFDCSDSDCAGPCEFEVPDAEQCDEAIFSGDPLEIPDNLGFPYETALTITGFDPGQTLDDITGFLGACVTMEHSWLRDLQIELVCPSNTVLVMQEMLGQTGTELFMGEPYEADEVGPVIPGVGYEYCWRPTATNLPMLEYANANNLPSGSTLPADDYQASAPFTDLLGCELNGTWRIRVTDLWGIDNGVIFGWSLEIDPEVFPGCLDVVQ